MKILKIFCNLFLVINIYFVFSYINEFYKFHICLLDLSFILSISNLWTLVLFSTINFILYLVFFFIVIIFFRKVIKKQTLLKLVFYSNILISFILFIISMMIFNHYSDVKLFKDLLWDNHFAMMVYCNASIVNWNF